jgi:hypothetical protein
MKRKVQVKPHAITCGQVRRLLEELEYERRPFNDHYEIYRDSESGLIYPFPKFGDDEPVPISKLNELRTQFYYRGIMERDEFDAYFAIPAKVK